MAIWKIKERYELARGNEDTRGDIGVVSSSSNSPNVDKIQISTTGNSTTYGNLASDSGNGGGMAGSTTRILHGGGNQGPQVNDISYKEIVSNGNFSDFGDLSQARQMLSGAATHTKAIFAGGRTPSAQNTIDFNIFASLGNSTDFGDLSVARFGLSGVQSTTRAVFPGGGNPANVIDFVTMASTGNATDFGDIGTSTAYNYFAGGSSETRGVFGGGGDPSNASIINLVEIASTGNSQDFGDLTVNRITMAAVSNSNRVCFSSGQQNAPGGPGTNVVDFVTIATTGDATDFGDATGNHGFKTAGHSNGHGGLPLGEFQRPSVTYMPGSGRVLTNGGNSPYGGTIEVFNITVKGSSSDFGDSAGGVTRAYCGATSNMTRAMFMGGDTPAKTNLVDAIEFASLGNSFDFGNLTGAKGTSQGLASTTRAVNAGGVDPSAYFNVIEYVAIATAGNFADFGDLSATTGGPAGLSSPTRGLYIGGYTPSADDKIDYITIASTGNATDFGNSTTATVYAAGAASETRGLRLAGVNGTNVIDYVTIANTGNATDFGDLTVARHSLGGGSNNVLAAAIGGSDVINTIDFVTIATTGDAADFGDLTVARGYHSSASDNHGGLQG